VVSGGGGHHEEACDGAVASSTFDDGAISIQGMERAGDGSIWFGTMPLSSIGGRRRPKFH
jgi:hypothetical protein